MGLTDYRQSITLGFDDPSFMSLIMAAMRKADDDHLEILKSAFPEIWQELKARYNAPGGCITDQELTWLEGVLQQEDATENEEEPDDED